MSGLCSLLPFLTGLGSALLGGLIGWHWLKRTRLAHLLGVMDEKDHNYAALRSTHEQHSLRYRSLQGDYLVADNAQKDWESKYHQISDSHRRLDIAKTGLSADFEGFKTKSAQKIAELERQLKDLTATHQTAQVRMKGLETDLASLKSDYESVSSQNKSFTIQVVKLTSDKKTFETAFEAHKTDATRKATAADKQYKLLIVEKTKVEKQFADEQAAHESTYNQWNTQFKNLIDQYETEKIGHADTHKRFEGEVKSLTFNWNAAQKNVTNWETKFKTLTGQFDAEKMAHAKTNANWDARYKVLNTQFETEKVAANHKLALLEAEKMQMALHFNQLQKEWDTHATDLTQQLQQITHEKERDLNDAISTLTAKQRELVLELEDSHEGNKIMMRDLDILMGQYNDLNTTHFELASELGSLERNHRELIANKVALQQGFDDLNDKHHALRDDFDTVKQTRDAASKDLAGRADENEKDDFSGLTGMDDKTRRRLYALGIYTYRQWANMNEEDTNKTK
jgi:chromosome segregation ATPase